MALTFEDVEDWTRKTGALETLQTELSQRTSTLAGLQDQLADIRRLDGWEGGAAHAARQSFDPIDDDIAKSAAAVGAVRTQVAETIHALTELRSTIGEAKSLAGANGFSIQFNGNVVDLWDLDDRANATPEEREHHEAVREHLQQLVTEIVSRGNDIEAESARVLWAANTGEIGTGGSTDAEEADRVGAYFALEPGADPQEVEDWWNTLGGEQQQWVVAHRPDWVRNLDGIPTEVRDDANRVWLPRARALIDAELNGDHPPTGAAAQILRHKLGELDRISRTIEQKDTFLIGLDTSGANTKAIVAIGNPDTADHVAVTVPGMGSQKDAGGTIESMVREGTLMRTEVQTQLDRAGHADQNVATIAWMNYDTPPGLAGAGSDSLATGAAPVLTNYLESVDVTSAGGTDPHLTLVGHSYGSLTAGLALQDGASGVVDDYVAYGSPGFYAMDEADLGMQQGHVFVMQAPDDPIRIVAETPWYGGDPADGSFTQLSTGSGVTPDGVYREGASGHSDYPRPFSADGTDRLRVTGYNTAAVIAGLPESAVPR